jgi:queuine tRNA-ribosyltransferase
MNDPLFGRLATVHNLYFFHQWVAVLRRALTRGDFAARADDLFGVISRYYEPAGAPSAA